MKFDKDFLNQLNNIIYIDLVSAGSSKKSDVIAANIIKENVSTNETQRLKRFYNPLHDNKANTRLTDSDIEKLHEKRKDADYATTFKGDKEAIADFVGKGNTLLVMANADKVMHHLPQSLQNSAVFDITKENIDFTNLKTENGIKKLPSLTTVANKHGVENTSDKAQLLSTLFKKTIENNQKQENTYNPKLANHLKGLGKAFWTKVDAYRLDGETRKDLYNNTQNYTDFIVRQQKVFNQKVMSGAYDNVIKKAVMNRGLSEKQADKYSNQIKEILDPRRLSGGEKITTFAVFASETNKAAKAWDNKFENEISKLTGNDNVVANNKKEKARELSI